MLRHDRAFARRHKRDRVHPNLMLVFILRRLAQAAIVMLSVAFIAFMLFQYVGDPVTNLLGQDATEEQRVAANAAAGLRDYGVGAQILLDLGVRDMILLSDRRRNVVGLEGYGLKIKEWRPVRSLKA